MYIQFSVSISGVLLPRLTSMVAKNNSAKEISDIFIKTGRIQCIVISFVLSGFIVFGQSFIDVWAGQNYHESFVITLIFFTALFIPLIQNTGIIILQARNQMKFRSLLYLAISIISLAGQVILAKKMGAIGCAISIGGALIVGQGIIMNIYYARIQKIDIPYFWNNIIKMLIMPIFFTSISYIIVNRYHFNDFMTLTIAIIIFSAIYIPCLWKFSINKYERNLFSAPIIKIRRSM